MKSATRRRATVILLGLLPIATLSCSEAGDGGGSGGELDAVARGEHYYQNVCIACHSGDPNADGTLGPALAGTPLAVIEAKVMRGEYPEGYTPKRETATMPRFEFLGPELSNIAAYLASVQAGS